MNNEARIAALEREVQSLKTSAVALEKELQGLRSASSIPYEAVRSLTSRGFVKTQAPAFPDDAGTFVTNEGFRVDLSLSGSPQTITVPAFPYRFLKLDDGSNMYIPVHVFAELP